MTILVTGASGFVGNHLCPFLVKQGNQLRMAVRSPWSLTEQISTLGETIAVGDFGENIDWKEALNGVEAVVHLASRVHVMSEEGHAAETLYRKINVDGTRRLAAAALAAGVKHFIFISSIKAVGESGIFDAHSIEKPLDAYGRSKLAAEQALREVASGSSMAITILRPPLVYGPGVGANFLRLLKFVDRGIPLPLSSIQNQRSLLYVGNLVSAIQCALEAKESTGGTFFLSDGEPVSSPDLIRAIALALHKSPRVWPCPLPLLRAAAGILGKGAEVSRLTESLVVDVAPFRQIMNWMPPFTLQDGLHETVVWYSQKS